MEEEKKLSSMAGAQSMSNWRKQVDRLYQSGTWERS